MSMRGIMRVTILSWKLSFMHSVLEILSPQQKFISFSDHSGLWYLFDQPNLNARKSRWFTILSEFEFQIRSIKGKQNWFVDTLSRRVQVNQISAMSSYGTYFKEKVLHVGKHDERYQLLSLVRISKAKEESSRGKHRPIF